jgi:deoxyribonuclease V
VPPATWPTTADALDRTQAILAAEHPPPWRADPEAPPTIAACFVCFRRGATGRGAAGEPGWAAAALGADGPTAVIRGPAGAPYDPGRLALREGALIERAVRALPRRPDVLLVDATGRDHPRRGGLALHLGAVLGLPTVGVTHRPLAADGAWPPPAEGAHAPLRIGDEVVGAWVRTAARARPLAVHAAWRTDAETAVAVVLAAAGRVRTPEPLRRARHAGRVARARDGG